MTPVKCHSQPTPCAYKGALARGAAPSTPGQRYGATPRRFRAAVDATLAGPCAARAARGAMPPGGDCQAGT